MTKYLGRQLLADFFELHSVVKIPELLDIMENAATLAGCTIVKILHTENCVAVIVSESHLVIHINKDNTWLDIFTCGEKADPFIALDFLVEALRPERISIKCLGRGHIEDRAIS